MADLEVRSLLLCVAARTRPRNTKSITQLERTVQTKSPLSQTLSLTSHRPSHTRQRPLFSHSPQARFQAAAERVKSLKTPPSDEQKLRVYGLFKQATVGDVNTPQPSMMSLDFAGKAKWAAWNAVKGTAQDEAKRQYIALVDELVAADSK